LFISIFHHQYEQYHFDHISKKTELYLFTYRSVKNMIGLLYQYHESMGIFAKFKKSPAALVFFVLQKMHRFMAIFLFNDWVIDVILRFGCNAALFH
jgi:hypothetical protein